MKKFLGMLMLALLVTGCGGDKTTTVCKGNIDELTTNTTTIEATDDQVNTMKAVVEYDVTDYVDDQYTIDYWLSQLKSINVDYESLDGVIANWDVDGTIITLEVEINYDEADLSQLSDAGVITSTEDGEVAYISLEETVKQQESAGLTCKEQ